MSPLCESYASAERLDYVESFYPLNVRQCSSCLLVQLPADVPGEEVFSDYACFSSFSGSRVAHDKRYAGAVTDRLGLSSHSLVLPRWPEATDISSSTSRRGTSRLQASNPGPMWLIPELDIV
jgi:hypothetical protein